MATLKEIDNRINDHSKRLVILLQGKTNSEKIRVTNRLIEFWKGQKKLVTRIQNRKQKQ